MKFAAWFRRWRGGLVCSPEMRKGAACGAFGLVGAGVWCMDEARWFLGVAAEQPQIYPL
jgi:hypothetical protein